MMWWAVFCAAVAAGGAGALGSPAPAPDALAALTPLDFVQIDPPGPDDESAGYMEQALGAHYAAPWLYLLPDEPRDSQDRMVRNRRPSMSVHPSVEVLRQKGLEDMLKERARNNRKFLDDRGKRDSAGLYELFSKN